MAEEYKTDAIADEDEPMINSNGSDHQPIFYTVKDRYNIAYVIFYIFGITSVLPWNMFITANKYYSVKFQEDRNSSVDQCALLVNNNKTYLQESFENYFAVAAMIPQVIALTLNTLVQHSISVKIRMHVSILGILVMFIMTTALTIVDTRSWQEVFFIITLVSVVIVNVLSAIFSGTVFGLGGIFPPKYTQGLMAGQGLGGSLPAIISILTTAVGHDYCTSAFAYFLCAVFSVIAAFVAFQVLIKLKYADVFLNQMDIRRHEESDNKDYSGSWETKLTIKPPFLSILIKILHPAVMVMLIFMITLSCFPGIVSNIQSSNSSAKSQWTDVYFTAVTCFLLFNLMDWFGRSMSGFVQWPKETSSMLLSVLVVLRCGFIPLFMLCNIEASNLPLIFAHDAYPIIFMVIFAFSNGYLGSLCMMYGPRKVRKDYRETAGNMMALFLSLGLAFGSLVSFALRMVILKG
ncbi:equilibrative nucleoside transporter 1-like [Anneissia japonica]|uniref:equilibrative nucleoside transporter 1-like n=1 Tax=Anneissia japonica TaxID=1529436 RepID=UPI001425874B|nr:equilibrative nucleoside transporter 1-like [Anneissia japonica]XP_033115948.1 equilibrative nucleoside transporter 1-like [Anneissia japonica]